MELVYIVVLETTARRACGFDSHRWYNDRDTSLVGVLVTKARTCDRIRLANLSLCKMNGKRSLSRPCGKVSSILTCSTNFVFPPLAEME